MYHSTVSKTVLHTAGVLERLQLHGAHARRPHGMAGARGAGHRVVGPSVPARAQVLGMRRPRGGAAFHVPAWWSAGKGGVDGEIRGVVFGQYYHHRGVECVSKGGASMAAVPG